MGTSVHKLFFPSMILFAAGTVCALARINVTRSIKNDKFTNPNRTAVSKCHSSTKVSSFDTCRTFGSMNTRAVCISSSRCCESCQCVSSYPSYLPHLSKCVSLSELNSDIFGPGSKGRSNLFLLFRLDPSDNSIVRKLKMYLGKSMIIASLRPTIFPDFIVLILWRVLSTSFPGLFSAPTSAEKSPGNEVGPPFQKNYAYLRIATFTLRLKASFCKVLFGRNFSLVMI